MNPQDSIENPVGWRCTGYTNGCFCPTCSQRDIARSEYLQRDLELKQWADAVLADWDVRAVRHG